MKDQIAVVTGGAQGIGLAVARLLAEQGARVASWDIDPGNAAAMSGLGEGTLAIECDITDLASVEAAYARTCDLLGTPSILVNSAGIAGFALIPFLATSIVGRGLRFAIIASIARHHGDARIVMILLSTLVLLFGGAIWLTH
ncbi:MAG: SDR family NAD(P)-dependent oxidoreductase [Pseudomonadota bacterium]|nr:SDR family NAD(P)-dependent oxidoreductase [Pseudomonadota bacterium]